MANKSEAQLRKEYEQEMADIAEYQEYMVSQKAPTAEKEVKVNPKTGMTYTAVTGSEALETMKDMATVVPQGITTWADEVQAGVQAGVKTIGSEKSFSDIYEEDVGDIRKGVAEARDRSPWATGMTEAGVGIGSSFIPGANLVLGAGKFSGPGSNLVLGAGKFSGPGSMIARGAFEGLGTAEDKMSWEGGVNAVGGAGIATAGALVSGGLKKLTTANPNEIRANVLGARTSEFKDIGIKDREEIAKSLKEMGLFSNTKVEFDPNKSKFIPKGKSLENLEKPAREKLLDRLNQANDSTQKEKMKILGKFKDDRIDINKIDMALDEVVYEYRGKASGMEGREANAIKIRNTIMADIISDMEEEGLEDLTVSLLEKSKMRISQDVGNYGKNPLLQGTPDEAQLYQSMYSKINSKLRESIGDSKYAKFNDMQQKFLTAKSDIAKAIASESAEAVKAGYGGWMNKLTNATLGSPETSLGMANAAEFLQKKPFESLKTPVRMGAEELPFSVIRGLDPSMPDTSQPSKDVGRKYNSLGSDPSMPDTSQPSKDVGRKYNSLGSDQMTPMQLAKTRLPRTSEGLLQNKELVIQKLTLNGVPEDMLETVAQGLNDDPESIGALASMLTMQFPNLFEKSKYNMFDGKILDPNERAKAADDTSKREDIDSIQRAKIISELNKTGKWLGE